MTNGDGIRAPSSSDKQVGDILSEISSKVTFLVREEIELAKAEVQEKGARLLRGAVVGVAAGVFVLLGVLYLLHGLAWLIAALLGFRNPWVGYGIVTVILFAVGAVAGVLAARFVRRGAPPTPDLAIEEAKKTGRAIKRVRP